MKKYAGWILGGLFLISFFVSFAGLEGPGITALWYIDLVAAVGGLLWLVISLDMFSYVLKRLMEAFFVIFTLATLVFFLLRIIPGGPFDSEKSLPPEILANIELKYGLNEPLYKQYSKFIFGIAQGDFGESYKYVGRSVTDIISESLPVSFQLGVYSLLVAFLLGIPLGLLAAAKHNTWIDNLVMALAMSGVSLPSFLAAAVIILIFSFWLDILPPALWDGPEYYILPMFTLGLRPAAYIARLTRASVLEVIGADFIRTAKAKGLAWQPIMFKHVLKNSLIPVLTYAGPMVAGILSGTFVAEIIFAIPGMGKHFVQSVTNRDYPLVMGLTLLFSAILIFANLLVDVFYAVFDPRIRLS